MNKDEKIFDTGIRILEILKCLLNENLSKTQLMAKLDIKEDVNNVYTFEAFIKYFNTLNFIGLKIVKDKNVYTLQNALYGISLTAQEKELLLEILSKINIVNNDSLENLIQKISYRLSKYIDEKDINETLLKNLFASKKDNNNLSVNKNMISSLKKVISDNQQVKISYLAKNKTEKEIIVELKEIREKNNKIFLYCYVPSTGRNKNICSETILSISQLPKKVTNNSIKNTVIFEVYGRLVSLYKLKEKEKVINFTKNCLVISNTEEDKDLLLRRLLKYGENCKIISPKSLREEFLSTVDEMILKLEVKNE